LSEFWMSFWTICGDVGDFGMIQNVMKGRELNAIARYLKVIPRIIAARPDDGLDIAGGDEDQIGANYPTVDDIMVYLRNHGFDPDGLEDQMKDLPSIPGIPDEQRDKVALRALRGAYKRHGTYVLARDQIYLPSIMSIE